MTQTLQPGQHPDADQLNAFVEHSLPAHEQQQTLAHLAACPDCRAIVYLAQSTVVEEVAHPHPATARRPWFSGWNLALPVGLALACLVLITVHLRNTAVTKNYAEVDKTAHLEQSPPPPQNTPPATEAVAPKATPAPIRKPDKVPAPLPAAPGPATPKIRLSRSQKDSGNSGIASTGRETTSDTATGGEPRQTMSPASFTASGASRAASPGSASNPSASQPAAVSNVDAAHRELRSSASQYNSTVVTAQSSRNQAFQQASSVPPPPATPAAVNQTVTVTDAPALETESYASMPLLAGAATTSSAGTALRAKKQPSLPSNLPAISTVSNIRLELAIDTAGALFRSEDAGVTWQPIPVQWTGRAVKLLGAPRSAHTLAKSVSPMAGTAAERPAAAASAQAAFELTNDAGDVWSSTDGLTWKLK